MKLLIVLLAAAALLGWCLFFSYRRQIRRICRQIAFLREEDSNLLVTSELSYAEVLALAEEVNRLAKEGKTAIREYREQDARLKQSIADLSHDIRTPLTSLDGYLQMLADDVSGEHKERYLSIIKGRTESLKEILEELFTYTKLQDEGYAPETEEVAAGPLAAKSVLAFHKEFEQRGMEPEITVTEESVTLLANRTALARVFGNLVKNSLVHGEAYVKIFAGLRDGRFVFSCANDAKHPETIDLARVTTRYYRAAGAENGSSSGLGLAIASGLTEKMGGTFTAEIMEEEFVVTVSFPPLAVGDMC